MTTATHLQQYIPITGSPGKGVTKGTIGVAENQYRSSELVNPILPLRKILSTKLAVLDAMQRTG